MNNIINNKPLIHFNLIQFINTNKIFLFINSLFIIIYCFYYNNSDFDYSLYSLNSIFSIYIITLQIIYNQIKKLIKSKIKYDYFIYNIDDKT